MISLNNVSKAYGTNVILENVNYVFPQKGLVCIMGPSGGGKTTLLNMLAGFDSDYTGEIIVGASPLSELNANELCEYRRNQIGFVFQNYHLLGGYSALENVMLPAELAAESMDTEEGKAKELFCKLGLSDKINQSCETLSGGQKQRVAITRALLKNPEILLCDEPTGALDRTTSTEIMTLLKELSNNHLVVVITHDEKILSFADEVLRIQSKKLVSDKENLHSFAFSHEIPHKTRGTYKPFRRAAKNLRVRFARYIAVALAISIGVTAFMFSISFGNVIEKSVQDFKEKNTAFNNGYIKGEDDGSVLELLKSDDRIENVYYQYKLNNLQLSVNGKDETMLEKFPMAKATEALSYGVMPRTGANEVALSPSLAKKFTEDLVSLLGKELTLTVNNEEYCLNISGIFNAGYDDFFVSSDVEQQLYSGISEGDNYSISYDVKAFDDIVAVSDMLEDKGIDSKNVAKEVYTLQETFRSLNRLFFIVSTLVLLIALFLCAVLLVKLQNTRYREIGLLSALGFQKRDISGIVRCENYMLGTLAAIITAALFGLLAAGCRIISFPFDVGVVQLVISVGATFACIMIISAAASFKLIHTEPAEALRK